MFRSNWFGFKEWDQFGLKISSTSSNEAVKLYDAALTQFAGWYDDPNLDGLEKTLVKLNQEDPNFILGQTLVMNLRLLDHVESYFTDPDIKQGIDNLENLAELKKDQISIREYKHVKAVSRLSKMDLLGAAQFWEEILMEYPNDMHALKMCFYSYFFTGEKTKQLKLVSKAYPHFTPKSNPYSLIMDGMMAFVLEETAQYREAEKFAKSGLEKNPYDGWTAHAFAHICEMEGRFQEAKDFMDKNVNFWTKSNHLACHNYWHLSLFNLSLDNFDESIRLFDEQILPRLVSSRAAFPISDAASLLWRLSMLKRDDKSPSLKSRFKDVYSITEPYLNKHIHGFNDVHFVMSCLGSDNRDKAADMLNTIRTSKYMEVEGKNAQITSQIIESLIDFNDGNYELAADRLAVIRNSIIAIGGSDAQRDVFNETMIFSAIKSSKSAEYKDLLNELISERRNFKKNDKFIQQVNRIY